MKKLPIVMFVSIVKVRELLIEEEEARTWANRNRDGVWINM